MDDRLINRADADDVQIHRLHVALEIDHTDNFPVIFFEDIPQDLDRCFGIGAVLQNKEEALSPCGSPHDPA